VSQASLQESVVASLLAFLSADSPTTADSADDGGFDRLALAVFEYQYQNNLAFQRFCLSRGKTVRTVKHWRDIPAVPINAFKELPLSCIAPSQAQRVFMTSGTTQGDVKGKHHHPDLRVYDASMTLNFKQRFMQGPGRIRMGILFPTETELPHSSLAHYLALAVAHFGTPQSQYLLKTDGLEINRLLSELDRAEQTGEPYALLGASYCFVQLIDALNRLGRRYALPQGSRLLDTGGFKGQSRELASDVFYQQLSHWLGIDRSDCINMYGMTELSTQYYDRGNASLPSVKSGPHWIASRVVDPLNGQDMPMGKPGILVHCDLANFNSVTTVLTEDVGIMQAPGFVLLGRAQGSAAKGCSLAVEEFLQANRA
jgi:hypothetical protein